MELFTSTISSLSSQVAELKDIQCKPLVEFLNLPSQISLVQEKLKTLDSLPNLLYKVSDTLNRFSIVMENASGAASMDVSSVGQAPPSLAKEEKNTKDANRGRLLGSVPEPFIAEGPSASALQLKLSISLTEAEMCVSLLEGLQDTPHNPLKTSLIVTISTYASGGGLILYQAYSNLYATTGRKAHLLGDKQIPSVGVFDEV
ncbi:hypothetical protein Tco_1401202 [Tanacetum coccineum]